MGIPQEPNAVFYHPLDDETESLKAYDWSHLGGSLASPGKVGNALSVSGVGETGELVAEDSFGAEAEFSPSTSYISVAAIDASRFVVAYHDGSDAGHGKAKVGTVAGTDVTFGAEAEFNAAVTGDISAAVLDASSFVVAYRDNGDSNHGTAKVGTVSGTDMTFGAETEFLDAGAAWNIFAEALDASAFVVVYRDGADSSHGTARVGAIVGGTDILFGAEKEFNGAATSYISAAALDSTHFVVCYTNDANSNHGTARVGTVAGTDITFGTATEFNTADTTYISAAVLSATAFVVAYRDGAHHGTAKIGAVTGTDITFGAEAEFGAATANFISAATLSTTAFVVAYQDGADSNHGTAKVGTVSGADITFGAESEFLNTDGVPVISAAALSPTEFVVAYSDAVDSHHGTAKVGTLTSIYAAAVGATRLVFSAWVNNPPPAFWGPQVENLNSHDATDYMSIAPLGGGSFVACYMGTSNLGYSRVCTVSGVDVTFGPEVEFPNGRYIACVGLTSTRFVVLYQGNTALVGTVDGTDITYGAPYDFTSGSWGGTINQTPSICKLTSSRFFMCWFHNADGAWQTGGRVGEVVGTTITWGAYSPNSGGNDFGYDISCDSLTDEKAVVCYHGAGGQEALGAWIVDISGSDVTWGAVKHEFATSGSWIKVQAMSSIAFAVLYAGSGVGNPLMARIGTVAVADITWGAAAPLGVSSAQAAGVANISPTEFVCLYKANSHVYSMVATVTGGTSVAFGAEETLLAAVQHSVVHSNAVTRLGDTGPGGGPAGPADPCVACYGLDTPGHAACRIGNA